MAIARVEEKEVEVVQVKKVKRVTLVMTEAEARTLASLLNVVGGSPKTSPRQFIDSIRDSLDCVEPLVDCGDGYQSELFGTESVQSRSIYFNDVGMKYITQDMMD